MFRSALARLAAWSRPYAAPTHTCAALGEKDVGSRVVLAGWLLQERRAKGFSFFGLKDSHGITQLVVQGDPLSELTDVPLESTVLVEGHVALRPPKAKSPVRLDLFLSPK